ncbi:hypothetical protein LMH87_001266 [Akanthomyces muscarius]|uniref:Uncharacterized protein n=1 Tax=Akanthomyces muscarius TaxID=2231603 RepID=A0A9W8UND2_AKAMU|nr:hypothetical protein LMH87_001266 [Akanthomyces muscarius]KAJ4156052.1 hypothetical protein LMH87_001266 [Akanthomyces muscarius]
MSTGTTQITAGKDDADTSLRQTIDHIRSNPALYSTPTSPPELRKEPSPSKPQRRSQAAINTDVYATLCVSK